jgi:hypothetical protein
LARSAITKKMSFSAMRSHCSSPSTGRINKDRDRDRDRDTTVIRRDRDHDRGTVVIDRRD